MTERWTAEQLMDEIALQPRCALAQLPTPLEELPRLSERLGARILVKRDDLTGLALGGNKVRKLEFLLGQALQSGADVIVTTGGSQSNHARLTAAACRRVGLECRLVLDLGLHPESQGNLLLDRLFGAEVRLIESRDPAAATAEMESWAEALRAAGHRPYVVPRGGSIPTGAIGYAAAIPELVRQLDAAGVSASHLYLATGSTGTHSGVLAGLTALGVPVIVQGISVSGDRRSLTERVVQLTNGVLELLGCPLRVDDEQINVDDGFRGPGYGIPTAETMEAIQLAARDEGLILDPVYTGKTMAGLIAHARAGRFDASDTVVFLHTGGAPALFAYNQEMSDALTASPA